MKLFFALALALGLAGCASFDGRGLVPGKSTGSEAIALMGEPAQRLALADGGSALYFSRLPRGRAVYVVTVGADGVMKSIEQRMDPAVFARIVANAWTRKEVSELLGPPGLQGRYARLQRDWWEYRYYQTPYYRVVTVQFSDDGVVREVYDMRDWEEDRQSLDGPSGTN